MSEPLSVVLVLRLMIKLSIVNKLHGINIASIEAYVKRRK